MRIILFIILIVFSLDISSQTMTPQQIIINSISYHDPNMELFDHKVIMNFIETRPKGDDRRSSISFDINAEMFQLSNIRDGKSIISRIDKNKTQTIIDGKEEYSDELKDKYSLDPKRVAMLKNYYEYLWLMPMKLNDPGTILHPDVEEVDFFGKQLLQIKVSYSPEVGKDIWYYYFNPNTYAMEGYRFYHNEANNDGEYIILEEESVFGRVKLPKKRTWYTHKEDKLLGTDILNDFSF